MKIMRRAIAMILTTVLLLTAVPASASTGLKYEKEGEVLYKLGLLAGYSTTDMVLGLEDELTREAAMKLIVTLLGWKVDTNDRSPFNDVSNWAQPYVAKAVEMKITNGISTTEFGGSQQATMHQLITWFLRALGYEQMESWTEAAVFGLQLDLVTAGELIGFENEVRRDELAGVAYKALMAKPVNSSVTLIEKLVQQGKVNQDLAVALGIMKEPEPDKIAVEDIEPVNLVQTRVEFNIPVHEESAIDSDNYDLGSKDVIKASLLDEYTVILTHEKVSNQATITVEIDDVYAADKQSQIKDHEEKVDYLDFEMPEVEEVNVIGKHIVEVKLNEPIDKANTSAFKLVEMDSNKKLYINKVTSADSTTKLNEYADTIHVYTYSNFEEGEYEFSIAGDVKDYAGYAVRPFKDILNVEEDKVGPKAIDYENISATEVTIIFDEPLDIAKASQIANKDMYHTNAKKSVKEFKVNGNKLTLIFETDEPLPQGLGYVTIASDKLMDNWGNLSGTVIMQVEREIDKDGPVIEKVEALSESKIKLTFNEVVEEDSAEMKSHYEIRDDDNDEINIKTIIHDGKTVTLHLKKDVLGDITIYVDGVEDLSGNDCDDYISFNMNDVTKPKLVDVVIYDLNNKEHLLLVRFNEPMATEGSYSVLDLEKYVLNGKELADFDDVDVDITDGGKTVELTIPKKSGNNVKSGSNNRIQIAKVADEGGNTTENLLLELNGTTNILVRYGNDSSITFTAEATSARDIELNFSDELDIIKATDFPVYIVDDNTGNKVTKLQIQSFDTDLNDKGNTKVVLELDDPLSTTDVDDIADGTRHLEIIVPNDRESRNEYNEKVVIGNELVADKASPTVKLDGNGDPVVTVVKDTIDDGNGRYIKIIVHMTEELETPSDALASDDLRFVTNGEELIYNLDYDLDITNDKMIFTIDYDVSNNKTKDLFDYPDSYYLDISLDEDDDQGLKGYIYDDDKNVIEDVDLRVRLKNSDETYTLPEVVGEPTVSVNTAGLMTVQITTSEKVSFLHGFLVVNDTNLNVVANNPVANNSNYDYTLTAQVDSYAGEGLEVVLNYNKIEDMDNLTASGKKIIIISENQPPVLEDLILSKNTANQLVVTMKYNEKIYPNNNSNIVFEKQAHGSLTWEQITNPALEISSVEKIGTIRSNVVFEEGYTYRITAQADLFKDGYDNVSTESGIVTIGEDTTPPTLSVENVGIDKDGNVTFTISAEEKISIFLPSLISDVMVNGTLITVPNVTTTGPNVFNMHIGDLNIGDSVSFVVNFDAITDASGNDGVGSKPISLNLEDTVAPELLEVDFDAIDSTTVLGYAEFNEHIKSIEYTGLVSKITYANSEVDLQDVNIVYGVTDNVLSISLYDLELIANEEYTVHLDYSSIQDEHGNTVGGNAATTETFTWEQEVLKAELQSFGCIFIDESEMKIRMVFSEPIDDKDYAAVISKIRTSSEEIKGYAVIAQVSNKEIVYHITGLSLIEGNMYYIDFDYSHIDNLDMSNIGNEQKTLEASFNTNPELLDYSLDFLSTDKAVVRYRFNEPVVAKGDVIEYITYQGNKLDSSNILASNESDDTIKVVYKFSNKLVVESEKWLKIYFDISEIEDIAGNKCLDSAYDLDCYIDGDMTVKDESGIINVKVSYSKVITNIGADYINVMLKKIGSGQEAVDITTECNPQVTYDGTDVNIDISYNSKESEPCRFIITIDHSKLMFKDGSYGIASTKERIERK